MFDKEIVCTISNNSDQIAPPFSSPDFYASKLGEHNDYPLKYPCLSERIVTISNIVSGINSTYKNGIALFVQEPALVVHQGIMPITFYDFESSTFLAVDRSNETKLLTLLSDEELRDLSIHSVNHWRNN